MNNYAGTVQISLYQFESMKDTIEEYKNFKLKMERSLKLCYKIEIIEFLKKADLLEESLATSELKILLMNGKL